jgi:hypothetical protein
VLTVASGAASQSGSSAQSNLAAAIAKLQPVPGRNSNLQQPIEARPKARRHFVVAGIEERWARSGVIPVDVYNLGRYRNANRFSAPVAAVWEHRSSAGAPLVQLPRSAERIPPTVMEPNNWIRPAASALRRPATDKVVRRAPARILPPTWSRLAR